MLSLARCREFLGSSNALTDQQVETLRQDLYALAEVALEDFRHPEKRPSTGRTPLEKPRSPDPHQLLEETLAQVSTSERHELEERAAILEFDAGLERREANRKALLEWSRHSSRTHPPHGKRR
jgi:hypothetical protein